jgi:hypothetical protein
LRFLSTLEKITPEVSCIETLSTLDRTLTDFEILNLIRSHLPALGLSESSVSAERIELGSTLRPPLMKQDLAIAQQHPRLQFASDFKALVIDPITIISSDESRFLLGDDRRWRQRSYGRQSFQSRCPLRDAAAG